MVLGGTFDHLHLGHEKLITASFGIAAKVSIGILNGPLIQDKYLSKIIEPYEVRQKTIEDYLKKNGYFNRSSIFQIIDIYGSTLTNKTIDSIIVTKETKLNAVKINSMRKKIGMKPLEIVTIDYIKGPDHKIISSKRIRAGEINRKGLSYFAKFKAKKEFILPEELKYQLRKPIGKVITESKDLVVTAKRLAKTLKRVSPFMTITIGDIVTSSLIKAGLTPDIQIIDFKSRQKRIKAKDFFPSQTIKTERHINKAGSLSKKIALTYQKLINNYLKTDYQQRMIIIGEEDLLALIAIIFSPLNSVVIYGQYDLGIVWVLVNDRAKEKAKKLLSIFE